MTRLWMEHLEVPASAHEARAVDFARRRASDALGGHTVWCAAALSAGRDVAGRLSEGLAEGEGGMAAGRLDVTAAEPLRRVAERLDAMLGGAGGQPVAPGPAERELCAQCAAEAEALVGAGVRPGDVVVLHDPLTAMLAPALRERGAHAVWFLRRGSAPSDAGGTQAWDFLRPFTAPADAYVVAWSRPSPRGGMIEGVAALIPAGDRVAAKESAPAGHLGWSSMLADVMAGDRGESVGGTRRARPAVAWR